MSSLIVSVWLLGDTTGCEKIFHKWVEVIFQIFQIFSCRGLRRETNRTSAQGRTWRTHHFAASLNLMAWHPNSAHCKHTCSIYLSSSPLFFAYLLHFYHIHLLHWSPLTRKNYKKWLEMVLAVVNASDTTKKESNWLRKQRSRATGEELEVLDKG